MATQNLYAEKHNICKDPADTVLQENKQTHGQTAYSMQSAEPSANR